MGDQLRRFAALSPWVAFTALAAACAPRLAGFPAALEQSSWSPWSLVRLGAGCVVVVWSVAAAAAARPTSRKRDYLTGSVTVLVAGSVVLAFPPRHIWPDEAVLFLCMGHMLAHIVAVRGGPRALLAAALSAWANARILCISQMGGYRSGCLAYDGPVIHARYLGSLGLLEVVVCSMVLVTAFLCAHDRWRRARHRSLGYLALGVLAGGRAIVGGLTWSAFDGSWGKGIPDVASHAQWADDVEIGAALIATVLVVAALGRLVLGSSRLRARVLAPALGIALLAGTGASDPRMTSRDGIAAARWEQFGLEPPQVEGAPRLIQDGTVAYGYLVVDAEGRARISAFGDEFYELSPAQPIFPDERLLIVLDREAPPRVLRELLAQIRPGQPVFEWSGGPTFVVTRGPTNHEAVRRWPVAEPVSIVKAQDAPRVGESVADTLGRWAKQTHTGLFTDGDPNPIPVAAAWPYGPRGRPLVPPLLWIALLVGLAVGAIPAALRVRAVLRRLRGVPMPGIHEGPSLVPWIGRRDARWTWRERDTPYRGGAVIGRGPRSRGAAVRGLWSRLVVTAHGVTRMVAVVAAVQAWWVAVAWIALLF